MLGFLELSGFEVVAVLRRNQLGLLRLGFGHCFGNQVGRIERGLGCGRGGLGLDSGFGGGFASGQHGVAFGGVALFSGLMAFVTGFRVFGGGKTCRAVIGKMACLRQVVGFDRLHVDAVDRAGGNA